jgi:hypothetical protein
LLESFGGRDVAKGSLALLGIALACTFTHAQTFREPNGGPRPGLQASFVGSDLTCTQPESILIPRTVAARAQLKARLLNLLRESLYDDAKGIVNLGREKEIKKLASKLKAEKLD